MAGAAIVTFEVRSALEGFSTESSDNVKFKLSSRPALMGDKPDGEKAIARNASHNAKG